MLEWFDIHWYRIEIEDSKGKIEIRYLPSTTSKLSAMPKPFLSRWRGDIGNREADLRLYEAGDKGTRIHYASTVLAKEGAVVYNPYNHPNYTQDEIKQLQDEYFDRDVFILQDQDEMWQVAKFKQWLDVVKPEIIAYDKIVYDLDNNEAGTIDFIFKIKQNFYDVAGSKPFPLDGGYYITDLKSGKEIYDDNYLQVADYTKMACNQVINEAEVKGALIIHTNATKTKKGIEGLTTKFSNMEKIEEDYRAYRHVAAVWETINTSAHPKMIEFPSLLTLRSGDVSNDRKDLPE